MVEAERGRLDPAWLPLPIDPGSWGRPPAASTEPGTQPAWVPTGAPPPAPPATTPGASTGLTTRTRGRRNRALAEAAAAVTLLAGLAFVAPGGGAGRVAGESSSITHWSTEALSVMTNLVQDSTVIENDNGPRSAIAPGSRRDNAARYRVDLAAAQRLPTPPDPGLAQAWRSMLSQLTAAPVDLAAGPGASKDVMARFATVRTELLEFEQAIRPALGTGAVGAVLPR